MKEYKVGDTIYVKGNINHIDEDDTSLPYCVDFVNGTGWITRDNIIDELPTAEPAKPTLPKDVADEISFAKSIKGVTFDDYIVRELIRSDYKDSATNKMIQSSDVPNVIEVLLNAWNNGYTVEKEPVSLVYVPGTNKKYVYYKRGRWSKQGANPETPVKPQPIAMWHACKDKDESMFEFTDAEITKFGLQDCEREEVTDDVGC